MEQIIERLDRVERALAAPAKEYLSIDEAAAFIGVSRQTLDRWRMGASGPAVHQVGRRVLYSIADLRIFMDRHRREALS